MTVRSSITAQLIGKMFAHLLLMQIRSHLLKHHRLEKSEFTPGKSTTDRIIAHRVLVEHIPEFRQGMLATYIDFKALDSVHRKTLGYLLCLSWIPARIIGLLAAL